LIDPDLNCKSALRPTGTFGAVTSQQRWGHRPSPAPRRRDPGDDDWDEELHASPSKRPVVRIATPDSADVSASPAAEVAPVTPAATTSRSVIQRFWAVWWAVGSQLRPGIVGCLSSSIASVLLLRFGKSKWTHFVNLILVTWYLLARNAKAFSAAFLFP
jgi:hypothetical protein